MIPIHFSSQSVQPTPSSTSLPLQPQVAVKFAQSSDDTKTRKQKKSNEEGVLLDLTNLGTSKASLYKETAKVALKVGFDKKALVRDTLWLAAYAVAVALTPLALSIPFLPFYYVFSVTARAFLSAPTIYKQLKQVQDLTQ